MSDEETIDQPAATADSGSETVDTGSSDAESVDADPFDDESVTAFDRAYVEKLRKENAKYRERAKRFESAFDGYTDDQRDAVLANLIPALVSDYEGTVKTLAAELGITTAEAEDIVEQAAEGAAAEDEKPLTRAEAERLWQERERERAEAEEAKRQQQQIVEEIKSLGYDAAVDEQGNPTDTDTRYLLLLARDRCDGDLAKAHELIEAGRQKIIAEHIARIEAENGKAPAPVRSGGVGGRKGEPPRTIREATAAANAKLEALGVPKR